MDSLQAIYKMINNVIMRLNINNGVIYISCLRVTA
jgi:hypothetical protein